MKNYLEKLIKVVNEEDWQKLKKIDLKTSKLKDYLNLLLDNRTHELPSNKEIRTQLKVGDNLHRKMKSVLLTKTYEALAPEGGLQLLDMLSRYRLYENFTRELERQEKTISKKKTDKDKGDFYYTAFHDFRRLPYSMVNITKLEEYGKKYLKTIEPGRLEEERIAVGLKTIAIKIIQSFFHLEKSETSTDIGKELKELKKAISSPAPLQLEILLNYILGIYYFYIDRNPDKSFEHLTKSKALLPGNMEVLNSDEHAALEVFVALTHYQSNRFKEAIQTLQTVQKLYPEVIDTQTHVINRLIELQLIDDNISEAKWLLDNYLRKFIDIEENDTAEIASISYIKYYLMAGDLDMAYSYLEKARKFLNKKFYLGHDIELRMLEIFYFMYMGDYAFAKNLITRGIKFLHEKAKEKEVKSALEKFRLMQKLCKMSDKNKKLTQANIADIRRIFNGYAYLHGTLLINGCNKKMAANP